MKMAVQVQVKGFKALVKKINTAEEMHAFKTEILVPAMKTAESTTKAAAPKDSGKLIGAIVTDIEPFSAKLSIKQDKYPVVQEGGRKPGGAVPPSAALEQWARKHGIDNVFMLAKSIAKRGYKGRFFRRKGRTAVRKELPKLMENMSRSMEKDWGKDVSDG